jgi:hypothetical protein
VDNTFLRSSSAFIQCGTHVLSFYTLTASFSLRSVRVRLGDFGPTKITYQGVQTFALEDRYGNFSGAVGLHKDTHQGPSTTGDFHALVDIVVISQTNGPRFPETGSAYPPEDDRDAKEASLAIKQDGNKEGESLPVRCKHMEGAGSAMSVLSEPEGKPM